MAAGSPVSVTTAVARASLSSNSFIAYSMTKTTIVTRAMMTIERKADVEEIRGEVEEKERRGRERMWRKEGRWGGEKKERRRRRRK